AVVALTVVVLRFLLRSRTLYDHGIPHLPQVDDDVFRSGQPPAKTPSAWRYLQSKGITDVLKFNFAHEGVDDPPEDCGITVHDLAVQPEGDMDVLDDVKDTIVKPDWGKFAEGIAILQAVKASGGKRKALIHCTHGNDRTGIFVGIARVLIWGWTKIAAWREMVARGFHPELLGLMTTWLEFKAPTASTDAQ